MGKRLAFLCTFLCLTLMAVTISNEITEVRLVGKAMIFSRFESAAFVINKCSNEWWMFIQHSLKRGKGEWEVSEL